MSALKIGGPVPDFTLPDSMGLPFKLSSLRGKRVVLYFYPKDNTSGCTKQACAFRDAHVDFSAAGTVIVGVSPDSSPSHQGFASKHDLPFVLLADQEHAVAELYDVWREKSMYGRKFMGIERSTFLIDEQGRLLAQWRKVKLAGHVDQVLAAAASR